jgi:hypothetical protein
MKPASFENACGTGDSDDLLTVLGYDRHSWRVRSWRHAHRHQPSSDRKPFDVRPAAARSSRRTRKRSRFSLAGRQNYQQKQWNGARDTRVVANEEDTMTDNVLSHPRRAVMLDRSRKRQIANRGEGLRLQEQIFKAVDDLYTFLDRQAFFQDEDKRRYLGIALVITCDTIGEMDITINEASKWQKDQCG